jgi:WD40 repeat protein
MTLHRLISSGFVVLLFASSLFGDEIVLRGHTDKVNAVGFSPDGKKVASGSDDGTVRVWQIDGAKELHVLKGHRDVASSVGFLSDDTLVTGSGTAKDGRVLLWDLKTGKEVFRFTFEGGYPLFFSVSLTGKYVAVAPSRKADEIHVFDVKDRTKVRVLDLEGRGASSLCFIGKEEELAVGDHGFMHVFQVDTGKKLGSVRVAPTLRAISAIAVGEGERLALGGTVGIVCYRKDGGSILSAVDPKAWVHQLAFTDDKGNMVGLERGKVLYFSQGGLRHKELEIKGYVNHFALGSGGRLALAVEKGIRIGELPK